MASIRQRIGLTGWRLWLLAIVGLYAFAGFVGVPWALKSQVSPRVAEAVGADLTIQEASFNPFTLALTLRNIDLTDAELGHLLSLDHFSVDLAWASLWRRAVVISDFRIGKPRLSGKRNADGRFNAQVLMDRLPESPEPASDEPATIPRIVLEHFLLDDGRLLLTDQTVSPVFVQDFGPGSLELNDFSTLPDDDGELRFQVASEEGGHYEWQGRIGVNPVQSSGRFDVRNESLAEMFGYVAGRFPYTVDQGRLGLGFSYEFRMLDDGPQVTVADGAVEIDGLRIIAGEEIVNLPSIVAEGIGADLRATRADVASLNVNGGRIAAWLEADGTLSLQNIFAPPEAPQGGGQRGDPETTVPESGEPPADSGEPEPLAEETTTVPAPAEPGQAPADNADPDPSDAPADDDGESPWTVGMGTLSVNALRVDLEDRSRDPRVAFAVDPLNIAVSDWSSAPGTRFQVTVEAGAESGGQVSLAGSVIADPVDLDATVQVADLDLRPVQPYLADVATLRIDEASLSLEGRLTSNSEETLRFEGMVNPGALELQETTKDERLAGWKSVQAEEVSLALDAGALSVQRIAVDEPYLRVRIDADGNLNLASIGPGEPPSGEPANAEPADEGGSTASVAATDSAAPEDAGAAPFRVDVGRVALANGSMDFADLSLPLPFATLIHELSGEVANISSDSTDAARILLKGKVNETGSALIEGTMDLLDVASQADVAVVFQNVEMPRLTPYSAKFGGYEIDEGRLNLDLRYRLADGLLDSTNRVVIEQLALGDKVESPEAMNLPLKLAVALLKDPSGTIDLELPVTGDVNDPEFHYGGVVMQVLSNVLLKVVTAPFKLLGSLVGAGEEDLEFVEFGLGSSQLDETARGRLAKVGEALSQRPTLKVELPSSYDPDSDGQALKNASLEARLDERRSGSGDDEGLSAMEAMYAESRGTDGLEQLKAEYSRPPEDKPDGEPVLDGPAYLEAVRQALIEDQPLSDADLQALGEERAAIMREALLTDGGLSEDRIAVSEPAPGGEAGDTRIRLKLGLTSG